MLNEEKKNEDMHKIRVNTNEIANYGHYRNFFFSSFFQLLLLVDTLHTLSVSWFVRSFVDLSRSFVCESPCCFVVIL